MKKTLVALAALAATAAFAQSTVTISGVVDAGIESINDTATKVVSGRNSTSNFTLAGTEDLGGGLKAVFKISSAFDASTSKGSVSTPADAQIGNNDMFVGLQSDKIGTVKVGRMVNSLYGLQQTANGTKGVSGFAATDTLMAGADSVYVGNAVQYVSPSMSGFSVQGEYAASESFGVKSSNAFGAKYANGPVTVTLARANVASLTAIAPYTAVVNQVAGSYDFGVAKAFVTYQNVSTPESTSADLNLRSYVLGVSAPVGPGVLWAQYGRATNDQANTDAATITGLGYKYSLSKRSTIYVNVGNRSNNRLTTSSGAISNNVTAATANASNGYGIGLAHSF